LRPVLQFSRPHYAQTTGVAGFGRRALTVRWGHGASGRRLRRDAALDWSGRTRSARPARWTSLFGADLWTANQKSPLRRCFKPRPPLSAGCAGFASGCRSRSETASLVGSLVESPADLWSQATVRPLVRMPTDRHTATGTCEFGRAANRRIDPPLQEKSAAIRKFFDRDAKIGDAARSHPGRNALSPLSRSLMRCTAAP
jgi:hypothetical protein